MRSQRRALPAIAGAKNRTYTLTTADVGSTIRVRRRRATPRPECRGGFARDSSRDPAAPNTVLTAATIERNLAGVSFRFRASGSSTGSSARWCASRWLRAPGLRPRVCEVPRAGRIHASGPAAYVFYVRSVGPGGPDRTPAKYAFTIP